MDSFYQTRIYLLGDLAGDLEIVCFSFFGEDGDSCYFGCYIFCEFSFPIYNKINITYNQALITFQTSYDVKKQPQINTKQLIRS